MGRGEQRIPHQKLKFLNKFHIIHAKFGSRMGGAEFHARDLKLKFEFQVLGGPKNSGCVGAAVREFHGQVYFLYALRFTVSRREGGGGATSAIERYKLS